jgi:hypothetical protein
MSKQPGNEWQGQGVGGKCAQVDYKQTGREALARPYP